MFTPLSFAALLAWALFSEVVGSMAGFGAATVMTPVVAHFMDMKTAVAVVAFFHICGNASRVALFWRHIDWALFARFGLASVLFALGGAWLSGRISSAALRAVFGFFLTVYALLRMSGRSLSLPPRPSTAAWGGVLSGFVSGLIGSGGPVRSAFLMSFGQTKERYLATSAMIALAIDGLRFPVYVAQGFLTKDMWWPLIALAVMANLGARVGKRLVARIPQEKFTSFVLWVLLLMGIKMLWDGLAGL